MAKHSASERMPILALMVLITSPHVAAESNSTTRSSPFSKNIRCVISFLQQQWSHSQDKFNDRHKKISNPLECHFK
jgi:hypothetical protein